MRQVIATAGHVDHGKSTLIRALTGSDPDRWAEEKRRGLTIDLGFAWTSLPSGDEVSFVDVPGHERFLGNMLAGLGPAPIVCFVVAADEGWQAQSADHREAIAALGIDQGLLVVTRSDLAPDRVGDVLAQARAELAGTGLAAAPAVAVSALTGQGMEELRTVLDTVVTAARAPVPDDRVRLWVDRCFTISGAGTIVTGTLSGGTLRVGETLEWTGDGPRRRVQVRGLQSRGETVEQLGPVSRAAVNLRGLDADAVVRGDALLTVGAWVVSDLLDVRATSRGAFTEAPSQLVVHAGTAAVPARIRPLGPDHARLALERPLPVRVGDRMVLRGSGDRVVHTGALVLDVDPPALTRRGDAARRAVVLAASGETGDLAAEVARRGAVPAVQLARQGISVPEVLPAGVLRCGTLLVAEAAHAAWSAQLRTAVTAEHAQQPLSAGLPRKAALDVLGAQPELLPELIDRAGLVEQDGRILDPRRPPGLGTVETAIASLEHRLRGDPFAAPEADDLTALGLGPEQLAAAARLDRLLRLRGEVILLPAAPALAMRELARLEQPFTASQARQALGTSRRVVIPLLEHLDARGWTRRIDASHRQVVR
ncbi:selenocysteine-specific translation elongation factor [Brachybacterium vulturis]|uniref:Selenocysteine-specific translation elongation factor n=1 Tax=Brachybacterium vulturis TaxID=2017484 RepID=A0A291GRG2_9MICO|nr:selenocysteine-specific translation elongation factor [Brachybacterium vulturis]ATG52622.1 selenocysteine-specific translation elongation factor [Brachybacterium vulturis]